MNQTQEVIQTVLNVRIVGHLFILECIIMNVITIIALIADHMLRTVTESDRY